MRLYTMRLYTRDAGRKLLSVAWTPLNAAPATIEPFYRERNENISDLRGAAAPLTIMRRPIEIKFASESTNFTTEIVFSE